MKVKKWVTVLLVLALCITTFTACGGGGGNGDGGGASAYDADNPIVFRLASDAPLEHIATGLNNDASDKVFERTDGRVKIDYYPASQLGGYETVYEEIVMGSVDIAQITIPDALDARLGAAYLPWYARNYEEAAVLYAPDSFMSQTMAELTSANGVEFLGFVLEGFIGMGTVKTPSDVFTPGTEKTLKLRSPAMATFRYIQEDLGFHPITIPYNEVPTSLQTGVVDGWIGGTPNMNYSWVGEIIKEMYVNYVHAEATAYVMSQRSLNKLTDEDRAIVIDVFKEQSEQSFIDAQENEEVYKQKLADDGVKVIELTDEQIAVFADFAREVTWVRLEEILTKELMDDFREEVKQFD